jgi:hypothetical protein
MNFLKSQARRDAEVEEEMAKIQFAALVKDYKSEDPEGMTREFRSRCDEARSEMSAKEYAAWLRGFQDGMGTGVIAALGRDIYRRIYG